MDKYIVVVENPESTVVAEYNHQTQAYKYLRLTTKQELIANLLISL
jgi:hypothetical protein